MKVKTSDLTGAALDWAAAKCDGEAESAVIRGYVTGRGKPAGKYAPSTDWSQGGAIIEREEIAVATDDEYGWQAYYDRRGMNDECSFGPTPLIAAMRCFVASRLGDEVEIPEGLVA